MPAEEEPSYFLELPPELRLLIYEYLVKTPTLGKMNILTAREHAPSVAILATSRRIRHEALKMTKAAVQDFFALQDFFLEWDDHHAHDIYTGRELRDVLPAVAALPTFPISRLDILYINGRNTNSINSVRTVASVSSSGVFTSALKTDTFPGTPYVQIGTTAEALGLKLSWKKDSCHYLDIPNVARSVLYFMGPCARE
ncbi:hypothetical protein LTR17_004985 [Elasticomyces elasticus]|nr:hypothetical protein LTR17_004985 [Elasticomyces elasticus]